MINKIVSSLQSNRLFITSFRLFWIIYQSTWKGGFNTDFRGIFLFIHFLSIFRDFIYQYPAILLANLSIDLTQSV